MNGEFLLDTNIVIALFAEDTAVIDRIRDAEGVFIPSVVLGELFFGAYKSEHVGDNVARISELALASSVLPCDAATGQRYGRIKTELQTKGRPIPENDIWIAVIARQHDLTLVSRDTHFDEVEDLNVEAW